MKTPKSFPVGWPSRSSGLVQKGGTVQADCAGGCFFVAALSFSEGLHQGGEGAAGEDHQQAADEAGGEVGRGCEPVAAGAGGYELVGEG